MLEIKTATATGKKVVNKIRMKFGKGQLHKNREEGCLIDCNLLERIWWSAQINKLNMNQHVVDKKADATQGVIAFSATVSLTQNTVLLQQVLGSATPKQLSLQMG